MFGQRYYLMTAIEPILKDTSLILSLIRKISEISLSMKTIARDVIEDIPLRRMIAPRNKLSEYTSTNGAEDFCLQHQETDSLRAFTELQLSNRKGTESF